MFHASRPLTAARAGHYYEAEFRRGDYYTRGDDTIPGRWFGNGARELGYVAAVRASDFAQLLEGRDRDGRNITAAEHGTGKRRAGWDFTVSADKSVSLVALVQGDERLIAAHDAAVERALEELQRTSRRASARGSRRSTACGPARRAAPRAAD
jgi:conjugative relaxase-like TrwC/TraI family protein